MADAPSPPPAVSDGRRGILWMVLAVALFVGMDTCAKSLVQTHPTVQAVWARYFFHIVLLCLLLAPRLPRLFVTRNPGIQLLRSFLLLGATISFYSGLRFMQLAEVSAIMSTAPLIVTALSMPVLGERVGPRRWTGVAIGFLGALIIIRPGFGVMQSTAVLPLAAAFCYALYQISTRHLGSQEPVLTTLAYSSVVGAVAMSVLVPFFWTAADTRAWLLMIGLGIIGGLGHFAMIKSVTIAPVATVAPLTYTNLIWATLLGYLVFDDLPDRWTVLGAMVIVASGLYVYHRQRRLKEEPDG